MNEEIPDAMGETPGASQTPTPSGAESASDSDAPAGGEGADGTDGAPGGAPRPKRRRGRRGGRRHRRRPAGTGAAGTGADDQPEAPGGETEAPVVEAPSGDGPPATTRPRTRRPAQPRGQGSQGPRQRAPRRPATQGESTVPAAAAEGSDADEGAVEAAAGSTDEAAGPEGSGPAQPDGTAAPRKRRRRGGRGRGRGGAGARPASQAAEGGGRPESGPESPPGPGPDGKPEAKPGTKPEAKPGARPRGGAQTKPRASAPAEDEKAEPARADASKGSTRLEARAQRAKQRPRRRPRRLTEEEAKELRGSAKVMIIHEHGDRIQIAVLEGRNLIEHYVAHGGGHSIAGNVYLGRVQNVLAGMEAAFVDIGKGRNAVLYAGEVNYAPEDLEADASPRIEKVLKPGQGVMVQVTKDPLGTKGARLTAQISLAGRYLVLAPEQALSGISRRLAEDERARLRQILRQIRPNGHGVIVRTAAEGVSAEALKRDLDNLLKIWEEIRSKAKGAKAPALLYSEPELVTRVVRDIFSGDFAQVIVDSRPIYEKLRSYLEETGPDLLDRLELHEGPLPVLEQYHVVEQIQKALERKVWLPSGGSIVIDRTEAMTIVDVNTAKFVGKGGSLEETVFKNNLEAAEEVARQLRLRDIGGIIVIDFIDMLLPQNREQVLRTLKRALSRDKTRSQVFEVSSLGLVEMTRKKVSEGLLEAFSEPCPNCEGRGIVITHEID